MTLMLALVLLLALLFPASAAANRMPAPTATISPAVEECGVDAAGCADVANSLIYVEDPSDGFAVAHELGHVFDGQILTDADRMLLGPVVAPRRHGWPAERFADAYAACDLGLVPGEGRWVDSYGYLPGARRHARVCGLIRSIGILRMAYASMYGNR